MKTLEEKASEFYQSTECMATPKEMFIAGYKERDGESQWVSVEDSLPEESTRVLFINEKEGIIDVGHFNGFSFDYCLRDIDDEHNILTSYSVTHWMPLPNLPQPPKND